MEGPKDEIDNNIDATETAREMTEEESRRSQLQDLEDKPSKTETQSSIEPEILEEEPEDIETDVDQDRKDLDPTQYESGAPRGTMFRDSTPEEFAYEIMNDVFGVDTDREGRGDMFSDLDVNGHITWNYDDDRLQLQYRTDFLTGLGDVKTRPLSEKAPEDMWSIVFGGTSYTDISVEREEDDPYVEVEFSYEPEDLREGTYEAASRIRDIEEELGFRE